MITLLLVSLCLLLSSMANSTAGYGSCYVLLSFFYSFLGFVVLLHFSGEISLVDLEYFIKMRTKIMIETNHWYTDLKRPELENSGKSRCSGVKT